MGSLTIESGWNQRVVLQQRNICTEMSDLQFVIIVAVFMIQHVAHVVVAVQNQLMDFLGSEKPFSDSVRYSTVQFRLQWGIGCCNTLSCHQRETNRNEQKNVAAYI